MSVLTVDDPVLLDFARDVGSTGPVVIEGARTRWSAGGALREGARVLSAPVGIVEYRPEEMTVKVRAGTTVADLHAALAAKGQRTSLPEREGTVGGAVVVGQNHLAALGRGRVREAVLQVRYVSADGDVVTGGGPVVKNVSGYSLPKLVVGSLGTLGLVVEVVLRTNPVPTASRWLAASGADPFVTLDAVLRPSIVLWDGDTTWVHLEGHAADVDADAQVLRRHGEYSEVDGPPALPANRWSLSPAGLRSLDHEAMGDFVASVGVGTVWAAEPQPARPLDPVSAEVAARMKLLFDPTGRLNPGRDPARLGG